MLLFSLLACDIAQKPQPKISKRVEVQLEPDIPGNIEVSLESMVTVIPKSASLNEEQKKRLWSLLHLIDSPCQEEGGSVLSSLKNGSCAGSVTLLNRAIKYLDKEDDVLIDLLTAPDYWFSQAVQGKEQVVVELWISEGFSAEQQVLSQLKQLNGAELRICMHDSLHEKLSAYPLPVGHNMSEIEGLYLHNVNIDKRCDAKLSLEVRSSPTWFIDGFRLRGLQSVGSIQRLISLSQKDRE